jgi:hypothetical protein
VQLHRTNNIFKRIWVAIKYIFGTTEKYGYWDTTILRDDDVPRLIKLLQKAEKEKGK